jgi:hypothetical protein
MAFKPTRTTRPVHCVESAHYTLYRESLIKGGDYNGVQDVPNHRVGTRTYSRICLLFYYVIYVMGLS